MPRLCKGKSTQKVQGDRLKSMLNRIPFSVLFLDHVEIPAKNKGYTHILTMMCVTKFLLAVPVTSVDSGMSAKEVFINLWTGADAQIMVVDNGFDSTEWQAFCKGVGACLSNNAIQSRANQVERRIVSKGAY